MRKIIFSVLSVCFLTIFSACGNKSKNNDLPTELPCNVRISYIRKWYTDLQLCICGEIESWNMFSRKLKIKNIKSLSGGVANIYNYSVAKNISGNLTIKLDSDKYYHVYLNSDYYFLKPE